MTSPSAPWYAPVRHPSRSQTGFESSVRTANRPGRRPARPKKPVAPAPSSKPRSLRRRAGSSEQAAALDKVGRWLRAGEPQVFRLFGYAGRR